MLYICIPAYNEATTIGVLIWRIRKMFQSYSREYEILVLTTAARTESPKSWLLTPKSRP